MKTKTQFVLLAILLALNFITAQTPTLDWAKRFGDTNTDQGSSVCIDDNGNMYSTGFFRGTVDFDPGSSTYNLTSAGGGDVYILKLDASGNFVWAKRIGGVGSDIGRSISIDFSGNLYVTGEFQSLVDFDPGNGIYNLSCTGNFDVYVLKLDSAGNFIWAKRQGGTDDTGPSGMDVDSLNNIYITGTFDGTVDFDPGSGAYNLSSAGGYDVFITKLDSNGNFVWANRMGHTQDDYGVRICVDGSGNVLTTGFFQNTVDFDPGSGFYFLASSGGQDIFVSKLTTSGSFIWAKNLGGPSNDQGISILVDDTGNVYTTGYFSSTADFNPGSGTSTLSAAGGKDIFISKLNALGNFVWAARMGGIGDDWGNSLDIDKFSNLYITGSFNLTADFDPGTAIYNLTSAGNLDAFISKLNNSGNFIWAVSMGGSTNDYGISIKISESLDVYATGIFTGIADFDPGAGIYNLTSAGFNDIFVQKLTQCNNSSISNISLSACGNYISPSGKYTWATSGTYSDTISNAQGCDSIITINLTIDTVDASVTNNSPTLTANATNATYQWLDCNAGPISGATNQSFTATTNGQYAVIVTQNGCTDTSDCFAVNNIGLPEAGLSGWNLYPNPSEGVIYIVSNQQESIASVYVTDLIGNVLNRPIYFDGSAYRLELPSQGGVYFVCIKGQNGETHFYKVIRL